MALGGYLWVYYSPKLAFESKQIHIRTMQSITGIIMHAVEASINEQSTCLFIASASLRSGSCRTSAALILVA